MMTRKGFFRALFGLSIGGAIAPVIAQSPFIERRVFKSSEIALFFRAPSGGWTPIKEVKTISMPTWNEYR